MNLGVPPFDDVHVRKALNYAYDKAGGRQLGGGALTGSNAGHIFPDGLLDNKLKDYNPYATPDDHGDLAWPRPRWRIEVRYGWRWGLRRSRSATTSSRSVSSRIRVRR